MGVENLILSFFALQGAEELGLLGIGEGTIINTGYRLRTCSWEKNQHE